jgi:hypothetical protein
MDFFRVASALVTVFGLLGLLYVFSNRTRRKAPLGLLARRSIWPRAGEESRNNPGANTLRLLRRLNLTAAHQLHFIQANEQTLLVCTHPQGCALLWTTDDHSTSKRETSAAEGLKRHAS